MKYVRNQISRFLGFPEAAQEIDDLRLLVGSILARQPALPGNENGPLARHEFRVYSEYGEDGIIQHLIHNISLPERERAFIEFGVQDYSESNTRFLLRHNNWRGLILDSSDSNIAKIKSRPWFWRHDLKAVSAFVTAENVNCWISSVNYSGNIGLLSIDIDGNDYWVWEAIDVVRPAIVVCEYNSLFGPNACVSIPYDPHFIRLKAHYSGLYFGCSIAALEYLARKKGYALIGSNSAGNNAFFVRGDKLGALSACRAEECWRANKFRQCRDASGNLTYRGDHEATFAIGEMEVVDVSSEKKMKLSEILDL